MARSKLFIVLICLISPTFTSSCLANKIEVNVSESNVFLKAKIPEFAEYMTATAFEEWDGQDQLLRAKGNFPESKEKDIVGLLRAKGFEESDDITFITGNDDTWWILDGPVSASRGFVKSVAGQDTFIKLVTLSSGERRFLLEQTGF